MVSCENFTEHLRYTLADLKIKLKFILNTMCGRELNLIP